jgi:hypothetical protein
MEFINLTENSITLEELISHEQIVLKYLHWDINLPNFSTWINFCTNNWNEFMDNQESKLAEVSLNESFYREFRFGVLGIDSFCLTIYLTQLVDLILYDVKFLQFHNDILVNCFIFLLILKMYKLVDFGKIKYLKMKHLSHCKKYMDVFNKYLIFYHGIKIENIFDHIQYCSCYMESIINDENYVDRKNVNFIYSFFILFN